MIGTPYFSMFPTFMMSEKGREPSPTVFVNNSKEAIIHRESRVCDHTQRYQVLESDPFTIAEATLEITEISEIKLRTISMMNRKEMSLHLMLSMEKQPKGDWDNNLLREVLDNLDYEEHEWNDDE